MEKKDSETNKQDNSEPEESSDSGLSKIQKFFEKKLHIFDSSSSETSEKILPELSLDGIVQFIKEKNVKKIITMAGAGISTSAGIPDFRSPGSGLYHKLAKHDLPHPQAIFEMEYFDQNPEPFFDLAKELIPEGHKPTPAHYFIRLLHEKGLLLRHYTQNIDSLERLAGLPEEKIVEAHGTFHTGHCRNCNKEYNFDWMKEKILETTIPKCEECGKVVKPDIIFFGESLPLRFHTMIDKDFPEAELLVIMGSSLVVQPFASLVNEVKNDVPRLLINKEKVGTHSRYDVLSSILGINKGLDFDSSNGRDVAWIGKCDEGCQTFADKLGWGEELKNLISKEHLRLGTENTLTLQEALVQNIVTKKC